MMRRPVVRLFEFEPCGVSIAWSEPAAAVVAFKAIVDIVARFLAIPKVERMKLEPVYEPPEAISATSLEEFAAAAPAFIRQQGFVDPTALWLNGQDTGFTIAHLDQGTSGVHCQFVRPRSCSDEARERFFNIVGDVLRAHDAANPDVDFDFGAYTFRDGRLRVRDPRLAPLEEPGEPWRVAVSHGPDKRHTSRLALYPVPGGCEVRDDRGELGAPGATYGVFPSVADACREALRLLRARYGAPMWPSWGDTSAQGSLEGLGYSFGRPRWRWWPPGFELVAASRVGPTGEPELADAPQARGHHS
jgi:hypothetical protein